MTGQAWFGTNSVGTSKSEQPTHFKGWISIWFRHYGSANSVWGWCSSLWFGHGGSAANSLYVPAHPRVFNCLIQYIACDVKQNSYRMSWARAHMHRWQLVHMPDKYPIQNVRCDVGRRWFTKRAWRALGWRASQRDLYKGKYAWNPTLVCILHLSKSFCFHLPLTLSD